MDSTRATKSGIENRDLPTDIAEAFRRAGDLDDQPRTFAEGFDGITSLLKEADVTVTLEDMYQPKPTRHSVHFGDTVQHVPCVMDAMIVALLVEADSVEIRSKPPEGSKTVRFHVRDDEITVSPSNAVVSFGIGIDESTDIDPDSIHESLNDPNKPIPTTCTVINSFPDSEAYERWAADVSDAAVMELSVSELFDLSRLTIQSHVSE